MCGDEFDQDDLDFDELDPWSSGPGHSPHYRAPRHVLGLTLAEVILNSVIHPSHPSRPGLC